MKSNAGWARGSGTPPSKTLSRMPSEEFTLFRTLRKYIGFAHTHLRTHGFRYSISLLSREIAFDLKHRVETFAPKEVSEHSAPLGPHEYAVQYQGADPKLVADLLALLPTEAVKTTFIDYGCGKGRVLILAAIHGFRHIVGVELQRDLAAVCEANLRGTLRRFPATQCEVYQGDAARFELPPGAVTAFFYNPFSGAVLEQVLIRLKERAEELPDCVRIVYVNPRFLEAFEAHGFTVSQRLMHRGTVLGVVAESRRGRL